MHSDICANDLFASLSCFFFSLSSVQTPALIDSVWLITVCYYALITLENLEWGFCVEELAALLLYEGYVYGYIKRSFD